MAAASGASLGGTLAAGVSCHIGRYFLGDTSGESVAIALSRLMRSLLAIPGARIGGQFSKEPAKPEPSD